MRFLTGSLRTDGSSRMRRPTLRARQCDICKHNERWWLSFALLPRAANTFSFSFFFPSPFPKTPRIVRRQSRRQRAKIVPAPQWSFAFRIRALHRWNSFTKYCRQWRIYLEFGKGAWQARIARAYRPNLYSLWLRLTDGLKYNTAIILWTVAAVLCNS